MCYGQQRSFSQEDLLSSRNRSVNENPVLENLRGRLVETEARLQRARAREAELSRRIEEMKRFVSVMEILETYLKGRMHEQQEELARYLSPVHRKYT